MANTKPKSSQITYQPAGVGAVVGTVEAKLCDIEVSVADFAIVADWNGTTGTDQSAKLQAVIDANFSTKRGKLKFGNGRYRIDSARIDFKRAFFVGEGTIDNAGSGGTELYVGSIGGLYTTVEENQSARHENFRISSSATKTANGQTLLDLTGQNYPRLENISLYGGQIGLKLAKGAAVETHYGTFVNVNWSRCYTGVSVSTGAAAQTHSFFGGRAWDCVEGYANEDTGASDINFYGTAFESDTPFRHAETATAAQTKWFACRSESNLAPVVPVGQFTQIGTYWSGNRRVETLTTSLGALVESATQIRNIGVNNAVEFAAPNVLPNSLFEFDPSQARTSSAIIPGWDRGGATHYETGKATEGNYIRMERQAASGTITWTSRKIPLKKGRYVFACGWKKENYGTGGVVSIDFFRSGVSFGVGGTYADMTFPFTYASSESAGYVNILQDIDDFQFRISCTASTNGRYFYVYAPQMVQGQRGILSIPKSEAVTILWGNAAPTVGNWEVGDLVYNRVPTAGGFVGWICTAAGAPGTWKTFGAISA